MVEEEEGTKAAGASAGAGAATTAAALAVLVAAVVALTKEASTPAGSDQTETRFCLL